MTEDEKIARRKAKKAAWYKANADKMRAYRKKWRVANPEKERAACLKRASTDHHKAKRAAWRAANVEKIKAYRAAWKLRNNSSSNEQHLGGDTALPLNLPELDDECRELPSV
jgi:hypothetical protein